MEITKFSEKDMNAAISMARQTWHGYYDEFRAEYIRCIAECIVRHNYTDEDLAFKITCNGEVKGIIFGTRKGKMADLSVWVGEQCKTMNPQEKELLERLNDYMDEADRNTIAQMGDGDVKLSLFISIQKGCGRLIKEVYNPKAFFLHAALLGQACAHCPIFPTAASRRSLGRVSVPMWPVNLSVRLLIVALVGRYPAN